VTLTSLPTVIAGDLGILLGGNAPFSSLNWQLEILCLFSAIWRFPSVTAL